MIARLNNSEISKIISALILFSFLSASILYIAGFYYKELGCDGGWYSYPALAISRGGSPIENLKTIDEIKSVEGVKALYGFKLYTSIRIFYTTIWFKMFPKNIYFIKLLSGLELVIFFIMVYLLMRKFCHDQVIRWMLFSIFINDKTILMAAATEYRPDIMVAVMSCLTFIIILRQTGAFSLVSAVVASCLTMLTHVTAIIPFFWIMSYFMIKNIISGQYGLKYNYKYVFIGILSVFIFLNYNSIFDILFLGKVTPVPLDVEAKSLGVWGKGASFILHKELQRWGTYFLISNVATLLVLVTGVFLLFRQSITFIMKDKVGLALFLCIALGFVFIAFFDPHREDTHVIPVIPFFFLIAAHVISKKTLNKAALCILIGLMSVASLSSLALSWKIIADGERYGYNIAAITKGFEKIIKKDRSKYIIVGPTEIWPFIEADKDVLIVDKTRSENSFQILEPIIDSVDYVVINRDYSGYKWKDRFAKYFPALFLDKVGHMGGKEKFISIYKIQK